MTSENNIVNSASKYHRTEEDLKKMTKLAYGREISAFSAKELGGGMCNAVYMIEADGERSVLKIAPPPEAVMMSHEHDITETEAKMLTLMEQNGIAAPRLIYFDESNEVCPVPYFFMSVIDGKPLNTADPRPDEKSVAGMKREVGKICAKICGIKADKFGIPAMPETYFDNNCDFVKKLFDMLFLDAEKIEINVPGPTHEKLLQMLEEQREILNEANIPCIIHTDTWDGNIMQKNGNFCGLIDYAAMLYGDPLMSHDFHDFGGASAAFLEGFGKTEFTSGEKIRISVYTLWQRLGMIVERGYRNYEDKNMYAWVHGEYEKEIANFIQLTK